MGGVFIVFNKLSLDSSVYVTTYVAADICLLYSTIYIRRGIHYTSPLGQTIISGNCSLHQ